MPLKKIIEVYPNIYCLPFTNSTTLGMTFLRFQEHYESPYFRGKVFTLKEYKKWYFKKFDTNTFDYCMQYVGFNLPYTGFIPFSLGKFDPLTKNEEGLLDQVCQLPNPFYIIGINIKHRQALTHLVHETAHGLYYLCKPYRKTMQGLVRCIPKKIIKEIHEELALCGYHKDVYTDEIQAYFVDKMTNGHYDIDYEIIEKFENEFKKYCEHQGLAKRLHLVYD